MQIVDVKVGKRARKQIGDLVELCESIKSIGLLHPIVVTPDGHLVSGVRRLEAFKQLGKTTIPHRIVKNLDDAIQLLKAERDENTCRLDFAPTEAVAMGEKLSKFEARDAKARQAQAGPSKGKGKKQTGSGKLPEPVKGDTRDKVAAALGMSGRTYEKAKQVVTMAAEEPSLFGDLPQMMDEKRNVEKAHREIKKRKKKAARSQAAEKARTARYANVVEIGDFREKIQDLPEASVSLILTDPPYDRKSIPIYGDLAREAARVLIPGGSLVCYVGAYCLPDVLPLFSEHLRFWWIFALLHGGPNFAQMREYGIRVHWKPLLWYVKETRGDKENMIDDVVHGSGKEKSHHDWQQGLSEAESIIRSLSNEGDLVVDPFCGGGTIAIAAAQTKRKFWICEKDTDTAALANQRISEVMNK